MQVPIGMGGIEDGWRRCASPGWGFVPLRGEYRWEYGGSFHTRWAVRSLKLRLSVELKRQWA
jgi:hypothetical protein